MGRQAKYPMFYPTAAGQSSDQMAWDFLLGNQDLAPEACLVWFENETERVGTIRMARKNAGRNNQGGLVRADWIGYANIPLSDDDKAAIRGGVLDGQTILLIIGNMLGDGHKLSLSYDPDKGTVAAAVTGVFKICQNAGLTMTSYARSVTDVLAVVAYKHEVVAKGEWTKFVQRKLEDSDIG